MLRYTLVVHYFVSLPPHLVVNEFIHVLLIFHFGMMIRSVPEAVTCLSGCRVASQRVDLGLGARDMTSRSVTLGAFMRSPFIMRSSFMCLQF